MELAVPHKGTRNLIKGGSYGNVCMRIVQELYLKAITGRVAYRKRTG